MKLIFSLLLPTLFCINLNAQSPIDTSGRRMITMDITYTKPYKSGNVYYEKGTNIPFTGILYGRYDNGNLLTMQEFVDGIGNGTWTDYDPEGNIERQGTYRDNRVEGPVTMFYENGSVKAKGQYLHWKRPIGDWVYYDKKGEVSLRMTYTR